MTRFDEVAHYGKCNGCKNESMRAHDYWVYGALRERIDNEKCLLHCGKEGCGSTIIVDHEYSNGKCGCGQLEPKCSENGEHSWIWASEYNGDLNWTDDSHCFRCEYCGILRTEPHSYERLRYIRNRGAVGHAVDCDVCDYTKLFSHTMSYAEGSIPDDVDYNYCTTPGCDYKVLNDKKVLEGKALSITQKIRN